MTIDEIKQMLETDRYDFLRKTPLGDNIVLLGLGGSYAYGTNIETSDVDIRGAATHSIEEIITGRGFEQVDNTETDTTVYSLKKLVSLLTNCNPNVIEMLGLRSEHYIYLTDVGKALLDNKDMFLSKKAFHSFGGYSESQFRRLGNKAARTATQTEQEVHILNSINNAKYTFPSKYFSYPEDSINLYIDTAVNDEYDSEIFMDIHLTHYPLRDYKSMWSEMNNIVKDYAKIGKRNKYAIEHEKLGKHMMHLIRLYFMAYDILEDGKIITYREKEHDFLMDLRNEKYLDENYQPTAEFFEIQKEMENKLHKLKDTSPLPEHPDYERINKFLYDVNYSIVARDRYG